MQTQIEILKTDVENVNDGVIVKVKGDIDSTTSTIFSNTIFDILNYDGKINIIADLENLRYINSTGLGAFLNITKTVRFKGGVFAICNINDNIKDVIDIIGASTSLNVYKNTDEALAALMKK
ncbi:MAG: STAS domain-containing protein [Chitinispirillales bacterium]|jgi:anti-anti-sigma factor|nr:STAS domain-containing protein [Chitinispirillales bacterium]